MPGGTGFSYPRNHYNIKDVVSQPQVVMSHSPVSLSRLSEAVKVDSNWIDVRFIVSDGPSIS